MTKPPSIGRAPVIDVTIFFVLTTVSVEYQQHTVLAYDQLPLLILRTVPDCVLVSSTENFGKARVAFLGDWDVQVQGRQFLNAEEECKCIVEHRRDTQGSQRLLPWRVWEIVKDPVHRWVERSLRSSFDVGEGA